MKRALLFLLLVTTGFFVLRMFDDEEPVTIEETETPPEDETSDADPVVPEPDQDPPVGDEPTTPSDKPEEIEFTPGGTFKILQYDDSEASRNRLSFQLDARDSSRSTEDAGVIEMRDFDAKLFDVESETNAERMRMSGKRGFVRETKSEDLGVAYENVFTLEEVKAKILKGTPVVPLDLTSSRATVDATKDKTSVSSNSIVTLTGDGIEMTGKGYHIELDDERLRIDESSNLHLALSDQPQTDLSSDGPLELSSVEELLVATASDNATIEVPGTEGGELRADQITLRGRTIDGVTVLNQLDAVGNVVWTLGEQEFRAGRLRIRFHSKDGKANQPENAVLEGSPFARLLLDTREAGIELPDSATPIPEKLPLEITCDDKLSMEFLANDGREFRAEGNPVVVANGEVTMRSRGDVRAWQSEQRGAGFRADTGVVLEIADGDQMLADAIEARFTETSGGKLRFLGSGDVRIERELENGVLVKLLSSNGLDVERLENTKSWRLIEGRDITIIHEDPSKSESFIASAGRVWDAELLGPRFRAADGVEVTFQDPDGETVLEGESLVFRGLENYTLEGAPDGTAKLNGPNGWIRSATLDRKGNRIVAEAGVSANLQGDDLEGRLELQTERLEVEFSSESRTTRILDVVATGGVTADWTKADGLESTHIEAAELTGKRVERLWADGKSLRRASNDWVATNVTRSLVNTADGQIVDVVTDKLLLRTDESTEDDPTEVQLVNSPFVKATGNVVFRLLTNEIDEVTGELESQDLTGRGHQLTVDGFDSCLLVPLPGDRVEASGVMRADEVDFKLFSTRLQFGDERFDAVDPELQLFGIELTGETSDEVDDQPMTIKARNLVATSRYIDLTDNVVASDTLENGAPWDFRCNFIRFATRDSGEELNPDGLQSMRASGNVRFRMGSEKFKSLSIPVATASGARLRCEAGLRTLRLEGSPAVIDTPAFRTTSSSYLEFDPEIAMLIGSGPGTMSPGTAIKDSNWELSYYSSRTLEDESTGSYVTALQQPTLVDLSNPQVESNLRASWLILWLDQDIWQRMPDRMRARTSQAVGESEEISSEIEDLQDDGEVSATSNFRKNAMFGELLQALADLGAGDLLQEAYFEGPINAQRGDLTVASIAAFYLNMRDGTGWLHNPTLSLYGSLIGQDFERLIVRSNWMRYTETGALKANDATVTPCDHEESHMRIVTGNLEIQPLENETYGVSMEDNRIDLYNAITIPLPPISYASNDGYTPNWSTFRFSDSARFGASLRAGLEVGGGAVGRATQQITGADPETFRSKFKVDGSWLGSRGVLLDLGFLAEARDHFWLEAFAGGLPDSGADRGYVRVPENERDDLRLWSRVKSRFFLGSKSWIDLRVSSQTDAGVQSEFYESEFEFYEERDTFLHWRQAKGPWYFDASLKKRIDDYRTEIDELPSAGIFKGRQRIGSIKGLDIFHSGSLRAGYLRRLEGQVGRQSPFGLPATFADGFGNQEVVRVLSDQRFEAPIDLGLGWRLTPFVGVDFRGWNDDSLGDSAHRSLITAGGRLSGSFWRRGAETLTQIGPYIEVSNELESSREGSPFVFDGFDREIDGDVLRLGSYGRISNLDGTQSFEVDVSASHVADRTNEADRWLPAQIFSRLDVTPFGMPVELWHDATYDIEEETTRYSLSAFAFRPKSDLRFEIGHRRGRAQDGTRLFEAAVVGGIWRANDKWEFEARQTISLRSNEDLDTQFMLRRFGHDLVFEIDSRVRQGEGSSLGFSLKPRFGWKDSNLGYVRY